jgi:hypothetical protein
MLVYEGRTPSLRRGGVLRHEAFDGIVAEAPASEAWEDGSVRSRGLLTEPCFEDVDGVVTAQRRAAELAALAEATNMGAGPEGDVFTPQGDELRYAQARLDRDKEQSAIAATDPGGGVRSGEEGGDLVIIEEFHESALEAFARDGEDLLAVKRPGGLREGHVSEECVDGSQAGVAAAGAVTAILLEVVEELSEESGVEVGEKKAGWGTVKSPLREVQEEAECIAVGPNRMGAGLALFKQALGEEGLRERRELGRAHSEPSRRRVARSLASWRSSGTASKYQ